MVIVENAANFSAGRFQINVVIREVEAAIGLSPFTIVINARLREHRANGSVLLGGNTDRPPKESIERFVSEEIERSFPR